MCSLNWRTLWGLEKKMINFDVFMNSSDDLKKEMVGILEFRIKLLDLELSRLNAEINRLTIKKQELLSHIDNIKPPVDNDNQNTVE